jgi:hypothetical protein
MAVDIGLIQAILDKGGYDQLSGKQKQIVDALIAQKAVTPPTANAPPSALSPTPPTVPSDTSGKQDAIDLGMLDPNGPPDRGFLESLMQGAMNFPQGMARAGEELLNMGANPDKALPMMKDLYSGVALNLAPEMGRLWPHTPEQQKQMGMAADLGKSYKEDFGSYQGLLNTIANKPERIALEALGMGAPELLAGGLKLPGRLANLTPGVRDMPELLVARSLRQGNPNMSKEAVYAAAKTKLESGVPSGRSSKAISFTQKDVNAIKSRTDELISSADKANLTWSPAELLSEIQQKIDGFRQTGSEYGATYTKTLEAVKNRILKQYKNKLLDDIPISELRKDRSQLSKELESTFQRGDKTNQSKLSAKQQAETDHYFARRDYLHEKVPGLPALDDQMHTQMNLLNMMKNREQARFHGGTGGPNLTSVVGFETVARGGPKTLSTITALKYIAGTVEDVIGTHLYNRFQAKPIMKGPVKRNAALNATRAYTMGSAYDQLLEDELN